MLFRSLGGGVVTVAMAHYFDPSYSPNLGFDGITIALLGRAAPLATIPGAIFIAGIRSASGAMQFDSGVNQDIVTLVTALILFFATVPFITNMFSVRKHAQNHNPNKLPPKSKGALAYLLEAKKKKA